MEWPWRRRVPRAWGEVKRASSCKGVSFSGSVVARSLPGIQLIVAWRVAPMRAAAAHGTRRASGGRGPRYRRGSSIDPRPRFIAAPCHAVLVSCVRSIPLSPSPARVRSSRMEDRDRESIAVSPMAPSLNRTFHVFLPEYFSAPRNSSRFIGIKFFVLVFAWTCGFEY